jgi:hypothetical protein
MIEKSAPVTLTGGAGFEFEDCVAAWFMVHLLSNTPPLVESNFGNVTSVDFQVSESDWLLDDLLITSKSSDGEARRLSISIKRNKQVTQNGFNKNFVETVWKQWLKTQSNPFVRELDFLCLIVGKLADTVKSAWDEMLRQALVTSPERMLKRLSSRTKSSSKIMSNLFKSLHCPNHLKQGDNTDEIVIVNVLKHILLLHFDFLSSQSSCKKKAIEICRSCLSFGKIDEANDLWSDIVAIAANLRPRGGTMDRPQLIRKLNKYRFAEFPEFRSDWTILQKVSQDAMNIIRTRIGDDITIPRASLVNEVIDKLHESHIQVLLGESGCGKSALAKIVSESGKFNRVIWFNNEHLEGPGLYHISMALNLKHDLRELLLVSGNKKTLLVFDAIDKFSSNCQRITADLINALKLHKENNNWYILLNSQHLRWKFIQQELRNSGLELTKEIVLMIESQNQDSLAPIFQKYPRMNRLFLNPRLQILLRNLKIIDWVTKAADTNQSESLNWIGESDLIEWLWKSWVRIGKKPYPRAELLKRIGDKEASSFTGGVPLSVLKQSEQLVLPELESAQLLRVERERVYFTHDLLGDWSRLRILIGFNKLEHAGKLRNLSTNPRWHHAIRLFSLHTLEQEDDCSLWFQLLQKLNDGSIYGMVASDIFLEAVALSTNSSIFLERLWPQLSASDGVLLQRLIRRFRHAASFPDKRITSTTSDDELRLRFSASFRIPYWPYWGPMLTFLHLHAKEIIKLTLPLISELCLLWLSQVPVERNSGTPYPWRREAAELALLAAREVQGLKAEDVFFTDGADEPPYEAFLYGAPDLPEEISALALELAQRRPPAIEIQQRAIENAKKKTIEYEKILREKPELRKRIQDIPPTISSFRGDLMDPWPDGPAGRIDNAFRKACTKKSALYFLMQYRPDVAKEVILALCIEPPKRKYDQGYIFDSMEFATSKDCEDVIFLHRPFLLFLQTTPITALETIVTLVNFATERWLDWSQALDKSGIVNDIDGEQKIELWLCDTKYEWIGDHRVFGWYRSYLIVANYVVSALMALEKWFYEEVNAGRDISNWVHKIIKEARSTAFAGVFVALAKKHPDLLLDCLEPILTIWQIFLFDVQLIQGDWGIPLLGMNIGEKTFNMAKDWDQMPHRKIKLLDKVLQLMRSHQEFQHYIASIREKWRNKLKQTKDRKNLELIIELLNPNNYKSFYDETDDNFLFELPDQLKDKVNADTENSCSLKKLISFPILCRKILDNNQPLAPNDLEKHWKQIRQFVDSFKKQSLNAEYLNNAVMGGIAVLFVFHWLWLHSNPKKVRWCIDQIQRIIKNKSDRNSFDLNFKKDWERFFGEIAVLYMAENASDKRARSLLFQGIFAFPNNIVELICKVAYKIREKLGDDFGRIVNLCRLKAGILWVSSQCQRLEKQSVQLQKWYKEVQRSFKNCTLPVIPIPLYEIASKSINIIRETGSKCSTEDSEEYFIAHMGQPLLYDHDEEIPNRSYPGINWEVIQAGYSWIPNLDEAIDEKERKQWIDIHRELLDLELQNLRTTQRDSHNKIKGTPYKFELWVFGIIARLIPQLRSEEKPEEYWQPILDFGAAANYWINSFLSAWFLKGSKVASSPRLFASHWSKMIQYALKSPLWRNNYSVPCYNRLEDLYIQLMGLKDGAEILGHHDFSEIISDLIPLYEQWASEWLNKASVANFFARFILKPSASQMMISGLEWLAKGVKQITPDQWRYYSLSDNLISVLCACWKKYRHEVETEPDIKKAFLDILNLLISKGNEDALVLLDQIVQSSSFQSD